MKSLKGVTIFTLSLSLLLTGCGVKTNHESPEAVSKSLVNAYQHEDEDAVKKCYGFEKKDNLDEITQKEVDYQLKFFKAHKAKDVIFRECKSLGSFEGFELVYVIYDFEIKSESLEETEEKGKKETKEDKEKKKGTLHAPAINLYFVKKEDKKYYVVPTKDITSEMSNVSKEEYAKFVKKESYLEYQKNYETFIKENPEYETKISEGLQALLDGDN